MRFTKRYPMIVVCLTLFFSNLMGQTNNNFFLQKALSKAAIEEGLSKDDIKEYIVTDQYHSKKINLVHTYLQQTRDGIPIYGARMTVSNNPEGKIIHIGNRFLSDLQKMDVKKQKNLNETTAILKAADHLGVLYKNDLSQESASKFSNIFRSNSISDQEAIAVRQVYVPVKSQLVLAFEVDIFSAQLNEWWQIRIDASNGEMINKDAWTVECNFHHEGTCSDHKHHKIQSSNKMATKSHNKVSNSASVITNTYEVFAIPLTDPNDGSRSIETAPWNDANNASPYGWHDTDGSNGAEFTVTRGNNVLAVEDRDGNNSGGTSPDGTSTLDFQFSLDLNDDPIDYQDAAITNLFYWNNIIHDVLYEYGFDEVSGNFQENNYGNGGSDSDGVLADAQDGSGTNNANFSTPADGSNPRMQMFEWNVSTSNDFEVTSPSSIAGFYTAAGANFGPSTGTFSGEVIEADPIEACNGINNGSAISGNIALIDRGNCNFTVKVKEAQNEGAIAAIICNNVGGGPSTMGGTDGSITIPSVMISQADCNTIKNNYPVEVTMTLQPPTILDSDLDNTVIIHEYGHGVSNRLTGGPAASSCLSGDEQMGEGWSDYLGLILTMKSSDTATTSRGMGAYLVDEASTDNGIRAYPYTTDMSVNPHTYDDINSAAVPHGVGSVWAAMLWEMTWDLIDEHGFDSDIYHGSGGNNIALQLVLDGMKLQPCNPGFIDGRDAILSADENANNGDNKCIIWEAFARRGLGYSAEQGSSSSRSDGTEAFDLPGSCQDTLIFEKTAPEIATTQTTFTYTITATNNYNNALTNMVITDNIPNGVNYVTGSLTNGTFTPPTVNLTEANVGIGDVVTTSFDVTPDLSDSSMLNYIEDLEVLPSAWVASSGQGSDVFSTTTSNVYRGINSIFVPNAPDQNTQYYTSPTLSLPDNAILSLWHSYDTEGSWDGGWIEISNDGGSSYTDIKPEDFISNPYNSTLGSGSNNDIGGKFAFSGNSSGYLRSMINLEAYAQSDVLIRFAFGSDDNTNEDGWYIDDVMIYDAFFIENEACLTTNEGDDVCDTVYTLLMPVCEDYERFYEDSDMDGFGDDNSIAFACDAPSGYVSLAGDCDDDEPLAFPGNTPDGCDSIDNDCDGVTDEDCGQLICDGVTVYVSVITKDEYHAYEVLGSDVVIVSGSDILFTAGDTISLDNGFEVEDNVDFEARIEECIILLSPDYQGEINKNE